MNTLDLIIIVAAVAYGIGGLRHGAVVGVLSMLGFFTGAVIGAQLASPIGSWIADGTARVPVAILSVLLFAMLGQLLGAWIAGHVKARIVRDRGRALDSGIGSLIGAGSVLLVAWMIAVPLASSPYPSLASEASHSKIVRAVNDVLPGEVRSLYSSLRSYLNDSGFPPVFGDLPRAPVVGVDAPDAKLPPNVAARIRDAARSVFKIYGEAPSCGRGIEGSGFVYAPNRIATNAHVVAGTRQVAIHVSDQLSLPATVVVYDPQRDVAVLNVPGLDATPLAMAKEPAQRGDPAAVVGYPGDGPLVVGSARVGSRASVSGTNIYGNGRVEREIYGLRAVIRSGNSGGPLLAQDGSVLGMVFATALDSPDTGYALTDAEIAGDLANGRTATAPVATGGCTPG